MPWTTPETFTAGQTLTAASMNIISGNLSMLADIGNSNAWTSFTPTWTNVTTTSATQEAAYAKVGRLYVVRVKFTFGASTAFTASPVLTLPNSSSLHSSYGTTFPLGAVGMTDVSTGAVYTGTVIAPSSGTTQVRFTSHNAGGTYLQLGSWDATNPTTWATGDRMEAQFMYEAAS